VSDASATPALPPWVKKRDGRVVPFDTDAISQDLFAAAESIGQPDPFLTRELTDGILHFLAADCPESIPSTVWICELVAKVVRELRQPRLAQAFAERWQQRAASVAPVQQAVANSPVEVVRRGLEAYSLSHVFSRDLAAAHQDGLLVLSGLDAPRELAAAVLSPPEPSATLQALQLLDTVLEARGGVAGWLAIDGAEYLELESGSPPLPRLLMAVLQAANLTARLHLNAAEPPAWGMPPSHGPLFADPSPLCPPGRAAGCEGRAAAIVQTVLTLERPHCPFAIDWHLSEPDFTAEADSFRGDLLESMVRAALGGYPVTFVFDRPRSLISLGPGLDRLHSYLLLAVGLDLPRLLDHTGITDDTELFLRKLSSLARLAVSAGIQKRHYLRETLHENGPDRSFLQRGFMLDRARLMITPLGLDGAVRTLTGQGLFQRQGQLELAQRIVQTLQVVLAEEAGRRLIDCVLDISEARPTDEVPAPARQQLAVAGRLHALTSCGTAIVTLDEEERLSVHQVIRLLEFAWRQTAIARVRLQSKQPAEHQPMLLSF
jgi:hypothetical protein